MLLLQAGNDVGGLQHVMKCIACVQDIGMALLHGTLLWGRATCKNASLQQASNAVDVCCCSSCSAGMSWRHRVLGSSCSVTRQH